MALYEIYLRKSIVVEEAKPIDVNELYRHRGSRRLIAPGQQRDVTPMVMQMSKGFNLWGCTYEAVAHENDMETGTLRMKANSSFSWGFVYKEDESRLVSVLGSHLFPMGPLERKLFVFAHRTDVGIHIDKLLSWQSRRRQ